MSSRVATCDEDDVRSPSCSACSPAATSASPSCATSASSASSRAATCSARSASRRRRPSAPGPMLTDELARLERLQPVFEAVAAVSEPFEGVYLVGGTVRDILLGERSFDVDIAVEGDAIALAQALADALGGRVRAHEKFGTAVVLYGDDERVDVVTARTEFYDAPAALPTVEHASIREDLFRRDFTINAMAVSLKGDDLGRLVDPFGGRRDLEAKTDPRPAQPLVHRRPDAHLPGDPLREPLRLPDGRAHAAARARDDRDGARRRPLVRPAARRARSRCSRRASSSTRSCGWPSSAPTGRSTRTSPPTRRRSSCSRRLTGAAATATASRCPSWRLGLAALARRLPPDEVYDWLQRLKVRRRDAERIAAAVTVGPRLVERLQRRRRAGRGGRARRARTRPTRRCSRSRSPTCRRCTRTSSACGTSSWRSAAPTSPSSAWTSRRGWGRSSPSCAGAS